MTAVDDPTVPSRSHATVQREGDFRRRGDRGAPVVRSLTRRRKRRGKKADLLAAAAVEDIAVPDGATVADLHDLLGDEPGDEVYSRPSSLGSALDSGGGLVRWRQRQLIIGCTASPPTVTAESPTDEIDAQIATALEAAGAHLAADRGTHIHTLCQAAACGQPIDPLLTAGEELGLPSALQRHIVDRWIEFRSRHRLKLIAVEANIINDHYRAAGSLDYLDEWPDGTRRVGDIKTGRLHDTMAVQLAIYAGSRYYNVSAEERQDEIGADQKYGYVYHFDLRAALDGEIIDWDLLAVDLEMGRQGADLVQEIKAWPPSRAVGGDVTIDTDPVEDDPTERAELRALWDKVAQAYRAGGRLDRFSAVASSITAESSNADIRAALERLEPSFDIETEPQIRASPNEQASLPPTMPVVRDEGGSVDQATVDHMRAALGGMGEAQCAWITGIVAQTLRTGGSLHMAEGATTRRYEVVRGLITLARGDMCDDDMVRTIASDVTRSDIPHDRRLSIGQIVSALGAAQATKFALLCSDIVDDKIPISWRDDRYVLEGRWRERI